MNWILSPWGIVLLYLLPVLIVTSTFYAGREAPWPTLRGRINEACYTLVPGLNFVMAVCFLVSFFLDFSDWCSRQLDKPYFPNDEK